RPASTPAAVWRIARPSEIRRRNIQPMIGTRTKPNTAPNKLPDATMSGHASRLGGCDGMSNVTNPAKPPSTAPHSAPTRLRPNVTATTRAIEIFMSLRADQTDVVAVNELALQRQRRCETRDA